MKEVVILGKGHTRILCPISHSNIWGVNDVFNIVNPEIMPSRIYDLHDNRHLSDNWLRNDKFRGEFINKKNFPLKEILNTFNISYFTNSISYMIAHAIYERYDTISLYGVDMVQELEFIYERPCVDFWLGYAMAKNISIVLPATSSFLKYPLYAFE